MAVIPETIAARFGPGGSEARRGLMLPWVPQQAILAHQACVIPQVTSWLLTSFGEGYWLVFDPCWLRRRPRRSHARRPFVGHRLVR